MNQGDDVSVCVCVCVFVWFRAYMRMWYRILGTWWSNWRTDCRSFTKQAHGVYSDMVSCDLKQFFLNQSSVVRGSLVDQRCISTRIGLLMRTGQCHSGLWDAIIFSGKTTKSSCNHSL